MLGKSFVKSVLIFFGVFLIGLISLTVFKQNLSSASLVVTEHRETSNYILILRDIFLILTLLALIPLLRNQYFFQPKIRSDSYCLNISVLIPLIFTAIQMLLNYMAGGFAQVTPLVITSDNLYQFVLRLVWLVLFGTVLRKTLTRFIPNRTARVITQICTFTFANLLVHFNYNFPISSWDSDSLIKLLPMSIDVLVIVFENLFGPYILIFGLLINSLSYGLIAWLGYSIGYPVLNTPIMYVFIMILAKNYFKRIPSQI